MTKKILTFQDLLPQTSMMEIIHPAQGPMGIHLELVGQDSAPFRKATKRLAQQYLKDKGETSNIEEYEKLQVDLLAACIVGWDCPEVFGEYSPKRATEIMLEPGLNWLSAQVEAYIKDRANFFRKSS